MWRADRPLILGHRGASAVARENTLAAFRLASAQGADGIELDVRSTSDDIIVVHHDPHLSTGGVLAATSHAELRQIDREIPTLEAVLDSYDGIVNIEIKSSPLDPDYDPAHRLAGHVANLVTSMRRESKALISSFDPGALRAVAPSGLSLGLLLPPGTDVRAVLSMVGEAGYEAIHPHDHDLDQPSELVETAERIGVKLVAWTVDRPERVRELASAGIDAIITNDPALAREAIDS